MKQPLVSIVLLNWNGASDIPSSLWSVRSLKYPNKEIIFVDNHSTDGSVALVRKRYPEVRIVANDRNLGYAGGNNSAIGWVHGDAVLFVNPDATVAPDCLDHLVKRLYSDTGIAVVQPKVLIDPGRRVIDSVGSFFLTNGLLYHYGREKDGSLPQYNRPMDIFTAKGVCMLVRRDIIDRIGLFDPEFFMYFEETDFCMRVWLAGQRVVYEPRATVYHRGGAAADKQAKPFILFHAYKNVIFAYLKNLSAPYLLRVLPRIVALYFIAVVVKILTGNLAEAWTIIRAFSWNMHHIRMILAKRRTIQHQIRVVRDGEYLPGLTGRVRPEYYVRQFFGGLEKYRDTPVLRYIR
ncbi:glycosyltransferase family 2 protein [Patescibacteria group bacterium]|nr:glycosyltransferase family 2 protein [Patescibacteria group bacterium]